ncbi:V-type ATP synthase subunit K [candidate division WOR-3 bacterium]|uniref:V-type ATP synthase subunit K n=1 Tax=candidate division WOR-3 bacterium TaxID=2052148 RepID=A0A9D5KAQ5_UNCW3|nr:V-type ATP synthase subunit K [candidate division WOR-3 bacterium]MBD3365408.1 V-type ATP synthase subunit K [candidate division WOR-3 bacterium]
MDPIGIAAGIMGAAFAIVFAGIGSAVGIGLVARVANGVLAEDPDKFGKLFILVVLPGTQGFYGFLAAFLIIGKMYLLGEAPSGFTFTLWNGLQLLFASLPIAFTGLLSGIHQGKVCAAGAEMTAKRPNDSTKAVIYGAMVETYAVLGLLITIFLLQGI